MAKRKKHYTWIKKRISNMDVGEIYNNHPIHSNSKILMEQSLQKQTFLTRFNNQMFERHERGYETRYFTGNGRESISLVMIDVDCHKTGTREGATAASTILKELFPPNLYCEKSTNGKGKHLYFSVDRDDLDVEEFKAIMRQLEQALDGYVTSKSDIEMVEIKGMPPVVKWSYGKPIITCGTLAKLPRDMLACSTTCELSIADVEAIIKTISPDEEVKPAKPKAKKKSGSTTGVFITPEMLVAGSVVASNLISAHPVNDIANSRQKLTQSDLGAFLAFLEYCTKTINSDDSMPSKRIMNLWKACYTDGFISRAWSHKRFKAMRDYLTGLGLIDWIDETYGARKAQAWKASDELMAMLDWKPVPITVASQRLVFIQAISPCNNST
jgi:hypothetical protein